MMLEKLVTGSSINILDVGAACIAETPIYKPLLDAGIGHLYAFDGDARQKERIISVYGDKATVFSDVISDGSPATLYLATPESGMSSILEPDPASLAFFNGFDHLGRIIDTCAVQTKRLDDIEGIPQIDLVKLDIQGSELSVLSNGLRTLSQCVAIQLEISFIPLYKNQPTFGEVDVWMRSNGYLPHRFLDVKRWSIRPIIKNGNIRLPFNQLLEADIVYVKDPVRIESYTSEQLGKLALIAHHCFASPDLSAKMQLEMIRRGELMPEDLRAYLESLGARQ